MTNRAQTFCVCPFCHEAGEIVVDLDAWLTWDRFQDDPSPIEIELHPDQPVVFFGADGHLVPCPHLIDLSLLLLHECDDHGGQSKVNCFEWVHPLFLAEHPDLFEELSILTRMFEPETAEWLPQTAFEVTRRALRPCERVGFMLIGTAAFVADIDAFSAEVLSNASVANRG